MAGTGISIGPWPLYGTDPQVPRGAQANDLPMGNAAEAWAGGGTGLGWNRTISFQSWPSKGITASSLTDFYRALLGPRYAPVV